MRKSYRKTNTISSASPGYTCESLGFGWFALVKDSKEGRQRGGNST